MGRARLERLGEGRGRSQEENRQQDRRDRMREPETKKAGSRTNCLHCAPPPGLPHPSPALEEISKISHEKAGLAWPVRPATHFGLRLSYPVVQGGSMPEWHSGDVGRATPTAVGRQLWVVVQSPQPTFLFQRAARPLDGR